MALEYAPPSPYNSFDALGMHETDPAVIANQVTAAVGELGESGSLKRTLDFTNNFVCKLPGGSSRAMAIDYDVLDSPYVPAFTRPENLRMCSDVSRSLTNRQVYALIDEAISAVRTEYDPDIFDALLKGLNDGDKNVVRGNPNAVDPVKQTEYATLLIRLYSSLRAETGFSHYDLYR